MRFSVIIGVTNQFYLWRICKGRIDNRDFSGISEDIAEPEVVREPESVPYEIT